MLVPDRLGAAALWQFEHVQYCVLLEQHLQRRHALRGAGKLGFGVEKTETEGSAGALKEPQGTYMQPADTMALLSNLVILQRERDAMLQPGEPG
jgi:hypothetical protein